MKTLVVGLAIATLAIARPTAQQRHTYAAWLQAINGHDPGQVDLAALTIVGWSESDLISVLDEFKFDIERVRHSPSRNPDKINDINRTLRRAAMLHADTAILLPELGARDPLATVLEIGDGRIVRTDSRNIHWGFGRRVLDALQPTPSADEIARVWYEATSTFLVEKTFWSEALPHLDHAREIFPTNALLSLYSGTAHEAFAAPRIQEARNARPLGAGRAIVGNQDEELHDAERHLRRALDLDPALAEGHVRYGRVLGLLGRHREALDELQLALPRTSAPELKYYALLLLGREQQAIGQIHEAQRSLESALGLFPGAQSAHLALGQLRWSESRRDDALTHLEILGLPIWSKRREDPWWTYHVSHFPPAHERLQQLRQRVASDRRP